MTGPAGIMKLFRQLFAFASRIVVAEVGKVGKKGGFLCIANIVSVFLTF